MVYFYSFLLYNFSMKILIERLKELLAREQRILNYCDHNLKDEPKNKMRAETKKGRTYRYIRKSEDEEWQTAQAGDYRVKAIQRYKLLKRIRRSAMWNIECITKAIVSLQKFQSTDPARINEKLPVGYTAELSDGFLDALDSIDVERWALEQDYDKYDGYPEGKIHTARCGIMMRSRGEVIIANILDRIEIGFRYEQWLRLPHDINLVPDFTVIDPVTHKFKYIEYCGMMGDPDYSKDFVRKINKYRKAGLIPGIDVLFLFDTDDNGVDEPELEKAIRIFMHM